MNEETPKLLIVDDDEGIRTQMKWALAADYTLLAAGNRTEAIDVFQKERPAAILLDLGLPPKPNEPEEGLAELNEIISIDAAAKVIIISGQGEKKNAIEAVGRNGQICIRTRDAMEQNSGRPGVKIIICDDGPGIEKAEAETLFAPFVRGKTRATGGEKSTGLGLAIVKKIVEGHGGAISVDAETGRGSTFYVSLPLKELKN